MAIPEALKHFFYPIAFSRKSIKLFFKYFLIIMGIVFAAQFMVQANVLLRTVNPVVTVGFIFIPFVATVSSIKVWCFAIPLAYLLTVVAIKSPKLNLFVLIFLVITVRLVWGFSESFLEVMNTKMALYEINLLHDANMLNDKFNSYQTFPIASQPFILEAIALNPFTTEETLANLAKINESFVNDRLESLYYYQPNNDQGLSVKQLVAQHPNTSAEVLKILSRDADPKVSKAAKESISKRKAKN